MLTSPMDGHPVPKPLIYFAALLLWTACVPSRAGDAPPNGPLNSKGKIAYTALTEGYWQIWVVELPEKKCVQITHSPADKRNPTWDPEGKSITYRTSNGQFARVTAADEHTVSLEPSLGFLVDPRISPTGKKLVYARFEQEPNDNTDLYIYDFETKKNIRITDSPKMDYGPAWSPDERKIAFVNGRGLKKNMLFVMNADGKDLKQLQFSPSDDMCPAFSPDGNWVVFASSRSGDYEICRVSSAGGEIHALTSTQGLDSNPCYSPDGLGIAFVSNRDGRLRIWCMGPLGENQSILFDSPLDCRDPAWWQPVKPIMVAPQIPLPTKSAEGKP